MEKEIEEQINDFMKFVLEDVSGYENLFILIMPHADRYINLKKAKGEPFNFYVTSEHIAGFAESEDAARFAADKMVKSSKSKGFNKLEDFVNYVKETHHERIQHNRDMDHHSSITEALINSMMNFESLWVDYQRKMAS